MSPFLCFYPFSLSGEKALTMCNTAWSQTKDPHASVFQAFQLQASASTYWTQAFISNVKMGGHTHMQV